MLPGSKGELPAQKVSRKRKPRVSDLLLRYGRLLDKFQVSPLLSVQLDGNTLQLVTPCGRDCPRRMTLRAVLFLAARRSRTGPGDQAPAPERPSAGRTHTDTDTRYRAPL